MVTQRLKLSRAQLSKFLPDHESVKQFEQLFQIADELAPDVVNELTILSSNVSASAAASLDIALDADKRSRSNGVLLWLSM